MFEESSTWRVKLPKFKTVVVLKRTTVKEELKSVGKCSKGRW